jgi:hypothetical protein
MSDEAPIVPAAGDLLKETANCRSLLERLHLMFSRKHFGKTQLPVFLYNFWDIPEVMPPVPPLRRHYGPL